MVLALPEPSLLEDYFSSIREASYNGIYSSWRQMKPFLKIELEKMYRKIDPTRGECRVQKNQSQRG